MHNYLRITRILKFLADFELNKEQMALLNFLRHEIFLNEKLEHLAKSFCQYWIHTIKDDLIRENFIEETKSILNKEII